MSLGAGRGLTLKEPAVGDLTDVTLSSPQNSDVLTYQNGVWINAVGGGGLSSIAAYSTLSNNTNASALPIANQSFTLGTPGYTPSGNNFAQFTQSANNYYQISLQNSSSGGSASSDYVVTANTGNDTTNYANFGINNSTGAAAPFTTALAAYLYTVTTELNIGAVNAAGVVNFWTGATPTKAGFFDATQKLNLTNALTAGNGGTGSSSVPASGQFLVGNAGGTAYAPVTMSGSGATISLASTGVVTISGITTAILPANQTKRQVTFDLDGSGLAITSGGTWYLASIPYAGTITAWNLVADVSGSIVIDVWKANAAVPTVANTITASALPTLSSAQSAFAGSIAGWTTSVAVGDVFAFKINSASTVTKVTLTIQINAT